MSGRKTPLITGEYYHVYNRGAARQPVFITKYDYKRALATLSYYRFAKPPVKLSRFKDLSKEDQQSFLTKLENKDKRLVQLIGFVLMPNHFHFLIRQDIDNGVSTYISRVTNSYTRYFNTKRDRTGAVFQGVFKSVHVESTEQLVYLSRYIHLNPLVSFIVQENDFVSYAWSSLSHYLSGDSTLVEIKPILSEFSSIDSYKKFIFDQADYGRRLEEIKHLTHE